MKEQNFAKISIKSTIISYKYEKFFEIMQIDGIDPQNMMNSLSLAENRHMVFKAGQGAGASGSFFFFSHDGKFLIKTLAGSERKLLLGMLDDYVEHIIKSDNKSLLTRIYGVFKIKNNYFSDLDIMVMQNTVQLLNNKSKKLTFDLKGSTHARKVMVPKDKAHSMVLKDLNFLEMNTKNRIVNLSLDQMVEIESLVKKDSAFLRDHGFMDYSLLFVAEPIPKRVLIKRRNIRVSDSFAYHIGIIDFLQNWSFSKRTEAFWKNRFERSKDISAIEPRKY